MQYRCKKKVKGFIVPKYFEGEVITVQEYNDLPPKIKLSFEENYDDETFAEQLERNQKRDDAADNN